MPASSQQNQNRWNTSLRVNVAPRQRGSFFRPKNGENLIRVLNFTHKVTKGDIQLGRYEADTPVGSMMDEFFIPMRQHFRGKGQRPTPCGRLYKVDGTYDGTCVLCDQADDLRASALDADQKAADRIRPSNKYPMNIVNLSAPEQQIMVWEAPYALLAFIQTSRDSTAYKNQELLGMQGRDILITYREGDNIPPNERYKFLWMDRDQAKKIHAKGEVVDLYGSPDYVPPQFQGLVTATPSKAQEAPAPSKGAAAAVTSPKPGKGSVEPQEMQEEIVPEETPAPPVKRGPGRPAKKKVEPTVAIRYRVGSKVKFIGEDDDGQPTELDGEIVADKNEDGQWSVLAGDTEYGVMEEEFIK